LKVEKTDFTNRRKLVKRVLIFLPIFAIINLIVVFLFTDSSDLLEIRKVYPGYLLLAAGIRLVPWFIKAIRIKNWMVFLQQKFSYWQGVRISIWSELGPAVTPTALGGQPIILGMLYRRGLSAGEAATLTTVNSVEDIVAHTIGFPLAILTGIVLQLNVLHHLHQVLHSRILTFGIALIVVVILMFAWRFLWRRSGHPGKIRMKILRFWIEFKSVYGSMIRRGKLRFTLNVLLSAIQWTSRYSITAILVLGLGYHVNIFAMIVIQMMVFALMSLVPTPGATGGAEGLFLLFFKNILPDSAIGTILIGWRFLDFYFLGIVSLIYIGTETWYRKIRDSHSAEPVEQTGDNPR